MSQNEEPLDRLKECLSEVEDPRIDRRKRHSLLNVLILALGAVICGQRGWEEIAEFAEDYEDYFKTILDLPNGTPSKDTFRRVFMVLDPKSSRSMEKQFDDHSTKRDFKARFICSRPGP